MARKIEAAETLHCRHSHTARKFVCRLSDVMIDFLDIGLDCFRVGEKPMPGISEAETVACAVE